MRVYESKHDYIIYEYNENEFFEWEKDTQTYIKYGIFLDAFKKYGESLYYLTVDFRQWDYSQAVEPFTPGKKETQNI